MAMAMASVPAPASLYVGDLDGQVTDGNLFDLFSQLGILGSVRVCRDSISGRSLGYGYVNYIDASDAARAMDTLNYTPMHGKPIRIMWSHRDPSARKNGVGNIFIKNLHESIGNVNLHDTFSKFGNILSCKVASTHDGKSKGYGFVHFESEEAAKTAIEKVNGMMMEGKQVYVGQFIRKSERSMSGADQKFTNLYIKNLEQDVTEELLRDKFSAFGKISNAVIMKDENGNSKGFGFINFDKPEDAKQAVESMNGSLIGSKTIHVGRAQKKAEREQMLRRQFEEKRQERLLKYHASNVYVKNIDDAIDDEELCKIFGRYGTITSAKVMRDDKGTSKGFGFVCFTSPEEANKALVDLSGYMLHGKPLYVAIAQRKEVRRAQLQVRYAHHIAGLPGPAGAVLPAGYPTMYYASPPSVVSQIPQRQGIMYPALSLRPGWRATGGLTPPTRPGFQPMPLAVITNNQRQQRPRGRMNGHVLPQTGQTLSFVTHLQQQQQTQPLAVYNDIAGNQQHPWQAVKYQTNGRPRETSSASQSSPSTTGLASQAGVNPPGAIAGANSVAAPNQGAEMLSSMLAAASPQQRKQMLGERLFPLVQKHQFELAGKITGMLLEMDNSELLLLLESPDSLASKVGEAVQVLKASKPKVADQDGLPGNFLTGEVTVS